MHIPMASCKKNYSSEFQRTVYIAAEEAKFSVFILYTRMGKTDINMDA